MKGLAEAPPPVPFLEIDAIVEGVVQFDADDRLVLCNQRFQDIYPELRPLLIPGTPYETLLRAEAVGKHQAGLIEDVERWVSERLVRHRNPPRQPLVQHERGDRWIQISERRTADGQVIGVHVDVTEARQREAAIERYAGLLRETLDNIPQAVAAFDGHMRLVAWNNQYFELLDLPHAFAQAGTPLIDIIRFLARRGDLGAGDPNDLAEQARERLFGTTGFRAFERETRGRVLEVRIKRMANGGLVFTYGDITTRKRAELALRESEERYALAAAGSNDGLWDWNLESNRIFFSSRWKEMLGKADAEIGDRPDEWFGRIHPDDVQQVTDHLDAHIAGAVASFQSEHRMRHADGSYRWMLTRGLAVRDQAGRATRIAGSQTDITQRKRAEQQVIHDALHDSLTGLPNRTLFLERVRQALARLKRTGNGRFAVIHLDLDRFKLVNESLGHVHGDELIIALAQRLGERLRFGDTFARLGGDEFALLLEDCDDEEAEAFAETLHAALADPVALGGKEIFTSASMGIAAGRAEYGRPEDLLRDAELAMYRAKELGKARAIAFEAAMRVSSMTPLDLDTDLRHALDRGEISLHYQPIIDLSDGRICGFEALMRWMHGEHGMISPADFIPLAEETGLIVRLGQSVLLRACEQMAAWHRRFPRSRPLVISVNLSSRQFAQRDLVSDIGSSLARSGLQPSALKLEITESALMENAQRSAAMLKELRDLDIRLSVDDFGTGYSSLSYLHTFPIDTLKIDKSFIHDMTGNRQNLEIVRTITLLANNLGLDVIAEGVETTEQLVQLRALGSEYAQGFLFARPVDAEAAERLLAQNPAW